MQVLEDLQQWKREYQTGWLALYQETGEMNWKQYNRPKNSTAPFGSGVDLGKSRLMFVSSAGGYLKNSQKPFNTNKPDLGDYTLRLFRSSTPLDEIAFAHGFYDHAAVDEDSQVLLPLDHLRGMVQEGIIGELSPSVVSFCGWQPDVERTLNETIPAIVDAAKAENVDAVLLVPA